MPDPKTHGAHVVLGVTASIALYKTLDLIRRMREQGYRVSVVMTREAQELIRPVVFQSLSGQKVYSGDMFAHAESWDIEHVALADQASCIVVAPATANIIAKIASGLCDDVLTCAICATTSPVVICPAMNVSMYRNPIVQSNVRTLKAGGYTFVGPVEGVLACGKRGLGCLAGVDDIVAAVRKKIRSAA